MKVAYGADNKSYLIKDPSKEFSTKEGSIKPENIKNGLVHTNMDKPYHILDADFLDKWYRLQRGAAIFMPKDVGSIIVNTGMGKDTVVAEAGGGSGKGTTFFAHICKHVHSFEIKPDHCKTIKKNIALVEADNVTLYEQSVLDKLPDIAVDIFILDLLETPEAMKHVASVVKQGGYVVTYNPHMTQVSALVNDEDISNLFIHIKSLEVTEREWLVKGKQARPHFTQLVHSGFLTFFRKK